jgi:hypothetical protein
MSTPSDRKRCHPSRHRARAGAGAGPGARVFADATWYCMAHTSLFYSFHTRRRRQVFSSRSLSVCGAEARALCGGQHPSGFDGYWPSRKQSALCVVSRAMQEGRKTPLRLRTSLLCFYASAMGVRSWLPLLGERRKATDMIFFTDGGNTRSKTVGDCEWRRRRRFAHEQRWREAHL